MRKILLATSALVAFAGVAQAAESPIAVNVGGYVDFRAAQFSENSNNNSNNNAAIGPVSRRDHDFETEFRLNIAAEGKASNGIEYGAMASLWNGAEYNDAAGAYTGGSNSFRVDQAYVWLSGAFGKVLLGDVHGASDLFVYAPTVGEGQIDGTYTDFTDPRTLTPFMPTYVYNTENSTKVTYYTPKVGNANHKVQAGVSYAPNMKDSGQNVVKYRTATDMGTGAATTVNGTSTSPYQDLVKASAQYTGNFSPVTTVLSATLTTGTGEKMGSSAVKDFTSWGVGGQAAYMGFTLGASYVDAGMYNAVAVSPGVKQSRRQDVWTVGGKYEFDKVAVAANYLRGRGYNNSFLVPGVASSGKDQNYVSAFNAVGLGATYTWFPGLTSAIDTVLFSQDRSDNVTDAGYASGNHEADMNEGYVVMLSQKLTF